MKTRAIGITGVLVLAVLAASAAAGAAPAKRSHKSTRATVVKRAWFSAPPLCTALDCSSLPPLNPYPQDTLHVALSGGQETARTYLALEVDLPPHTQPTGGTLTLPVDADPADGSLRPEEARFVACLAKGKFDDQRGDFADAPKANCEVRRSAVYDEKKALYTVELGDFVTEWTGKKASLALVPSEAAQKSNDSWRVVFPAAKKKSKDSPAITATIEYGPKTEITDFGFGSGGGGVGSGTSSGSDFGSSSGSDFGSSSGSGSGFGSSGASSGGGSGGLGSGSITGGTATAAPAAPDTQPNVAAPPASLVGFAGKGFAYPMAWALPLALLIGLAASGRSLTKSLYRRGL